MSASSALLRIARRSLHSSTAVRAAAKAKKAPTAAPGASAVAPEAAKDVYDMKPDSKGYYGRAVSYTDVHTQSLHTFYDLEIRMRQKRLPQPVPGVPVPPPMK